MLAAGGLEQPRREAAWLLMHYCQWSLDRIYSRPDLELSDSLAGEIRQAGQRRARHEPMAYIVGEAGFYKHLFYVGPGVLIPRADTEILVETALAAIASAGHAAIPSVRTDAGDNPRRGLRILDTCTGSGCVGISLALELQAAGQPVELTLIDIDSQALAYARRNAGRHALASIRLIQGDLWPPSHMVPPGGFDLIVANPPYIRPAVITGLMPEVREHEPHQALDGGPDGLDFYRRLTRQAGDYLHRPGLLLFEHGYDQGAAVAGLLADSGWQYRQARCDYGGQPRVAGGWLM